MVQKPKTPVPTSADVARLAGVSRATVSYVLNNTRAVRISEPTRLRVREAAEQLGYVPHAAARSLRAGHSRTVVMPAPAFPAGPLYTRFLGELQSALGRLDYTVVQYGGAAPYGDDAARAWAELRPIAVLVPGPGLGPGGVEVLKRSGARAVVTLGPEPVEGAHALVLDQTAVGHAAARHLYERGRRRVGVVLPEEPGLRIFSSPRLRGARSALRGTGATLTELPLACAEDAAARLAARWDALALDAVFAYDDAYAMLLSRALQDHGVTLPGRTAVIGADDLMLGPLLRPRLSTVRLELPAGQDLAALVDRAVRDPGAAPERHTVRGVTVVHRESS
ncbi:LacI family DNA-binding transcriptional regulator [Streptomyces griseoviridis]|uniref:LacI family transcriptional regulator n=3 Tax=Streptomyces TaxID=1883 RepID=A0A918GK98_STRGD|nr:MULTISPECIES: LacI family DNA-binding transcriptional regulator [Streptomyces]GGS43498.1 LacI family transcriptional regulator [Streptomyces niveoruber]GGS77339.1 LacI family transcriptional regulator [Streptomyces griseoviridis]GGU14756.1 LacI family transcriptional regulator [Streptomyces daghestanicus]GHI35099.1 LacI family transcriptional regulator [Streptomyces daghestanicus]